MKKTIALSLAGAAFLLAAGCGGGGPGSATATVPVTAPVTPASDDFTQTVITAFGATSETTTPVATDAIVATSSETSNPVALN